jgi:NADH:ubiquinone oxidoreductase subunit 4 (chain M)
LLIPKDFLKGIWGGSNRRNATIKLILYTVFGSIFILAGTIYTGVLSYISSGKFALEFESIASMSITTSQSEI